MNTKVVNDQSQRYEHVEGTINELMNGKPGSSYDQTQQQQPGSSDALLPGKARANLQVLDGNRWLSFTGNQDGPKSTGDWLVIDWLVKELSRAAGAVAEPRLGPQETINPGHMPTNPFPFSPGRLNRRLDRGPCNTDIAALLVV